MHSIDVGLAKINIIDMLNDNISILIIDIVDNHPVLMKHFSSRKKVYKSCGGIIKKICLTKKKL